MNTSDFSGIPPALMERILARLGFSQPPEPTLEGLRQLYGAWCRKVPFDNVRKLIHLRSGDPGPLPGSTAGDFFTAWLAHGTGGTCWAGSTALHALLDALGFSVERGIATMLVTPDLPPNHGTTSVRLDGEIHLVDSSMLHGEPLLVSDLYMTGIPHPAWGVSCAPRDGLHHILWRPLHQPDGFECRLERSRGDERGFAGCYEATRAWSPFNHQLTARLNSGGEVIGIVMGKAILLHSDGGVSQGPASHREMKKILLDEFGMSEEIVSRLPADQPTPPPPGSATATRI